MRTPTVVRNNLYFKKYTNDKERTERDRVIQIHRQSKREMTECFEQMTECRRVARGNLQDVFELYENTWRH